MLANILVSGSIYVLVALGYVLIYRSSRVLNFAHGEIFMVGGYLTFVFLSTTGLDPIAALPFSLILGAIIGILVYFVLMAPMAGHPIFAAVLVTIGFGIIVRGLALMGFQGQILYPGRMLGITPQPIEIAPGFVLTTHDFSIIVSAIVVMIALVLFFRYSSFGIRMRVASHDTRLAGYRGINIHAVFATSWAIATSLAVYTSALYSFSHQVNPNLTEIGIRGLAVALVGGMDSIKGIIPAAIIVACAEQLSIKYISPQSADAIPFIVLLIVLILRPWGLFGTKEVIDRI